MAIGGNSFVIGSRFFYVLPKGTGGRKESVYLLCTVVNVTSKRVVIRLDHNPHHRNVLPWALTDKDANGQPVREVA